MIISIHLPKTAGTSFGATLESYYGTTFLRDYADRPLNSSQYERNKSALHHCLSNLLKNNKDISCIHGHFLPIKYLPLLDNKDIKFITWFRNPVDRVLSHYYYWQKTPPTVNISSIRKKMIEDEWSLERFCLGPEVKNLYSQFLFGFPLEYFSFIGITEFYDDDFEFFMHNYLKTSTQPKRLNISKNTYAISDSLRNDIEQFHEKDMELYNRALALRSIL